MNDSFFITSALKIYRIICYEIQYSTFYAIYSKICWWLSSEFEASSILSFFRAKWGRSVRSSCIAGGITKTLNGIGRLMKYRNGAFPEAVRESFIISKLNDRFIVFLLCIIFFALPFLPTMLLAVICMATMAVYILNIFVGSIKVKNAGLVSVFVGLFGLCFIYGSLSSYNFPKSLLVMVIFIVFMGMFFVVKDCVNNEKRFNLVMNVFIISGVIIALYAIYQYITGVEMDAAWIDKESFENVTTRAYATFSNPNVLGEYLIVLTSLAVGMLWKAKSLFIKIYYIGCCGVLSMGLAATNSRGAMLGLLLSAGFFVLLSEKRLIILGVVGLIMLPFVLPQTLWARLASVIMLNDSSSLYRMSIYKASFDIVKDYWSTGIGVDAFGLIYPLFSFEAAYAYHSHNLFLQELIELGVVGFTVFASVILLFFQRLYSSISQAKKKHKFMLGAIFGGFAGILLQGMVDHLWFDYSIILLFWLVMGLGMSLVLIGEKQNDR